IQQTMMYPAIPKNWGEWSSFKPSKIQKVKFKGIASKKPVYLAPYVISGIQAAYEPSADGLGYDKDSKSKLNGGLDAKFTLGSAWAMDLTANTDFAQVEADDQQVNLTRFDLFFPEKRVFFQERSSVFSFNTGNFNQLFYSRRIGLDNTNNLLPILGGARVIGRVKGWDVGFLDMQTAKADQQLSTNYGVFRLRKQISDNNSYAGVMVTNRVDTDGNYSSSVGTDLIYNVFGSSYLNASVSGIVDTSTNTGIESSKLYLNLTRRGIEGFGYNLTYSRIGANFNPAMGFELRNNNNQYGNRIWYGWMNTPESRFFYNQLFVKGDYFQNISDGKFDSELLGVGWKFATKTGPSGEISFNFSGENIREEFNIYNSLIPTGQYRYNGLEFMFTSGFSRDITLTMMGYGGSFYNGKNINLVFMPVWKPNETLLMSLNYIYSNLDFSGTSNDTELHLFGWKTELTLNTKLSAALYWQYNNIGKKLNGNLRFRYNPREGVDLYIVYNDIENTNRYREVPTLPTYDSRTLIVKYIYTFVL
ncbi:MAG: DUF5916 domain-containing protein, partial [Cyclobacteriaceae bacterium]|nr:DUF5916 domain-containing protein [Cyclobacteriaceae bacterium]